MSALILKFNSMEDLKMQYHHNNIILYSINKKYISNFQKFFDEELILYKTKN